jgi:hypothetical protein
MDTAIEFEFEELVPVLEDRIVTGMMLYGKAVLESADPSDAHEFFVSSVELDGGLVLTPSGGVPAGHHSISKDLFKAVAAIIQNPKHPIGKQAQMEFGEAADEGAFEARRPTIYSATHKRRLLAYLDAGHPVGANLHE